MKWEAFYWFKKSFKWTEVLLPQASLFSLLLWLLPGGTHWKTRTAGEQLKVKKKTTQTSQTLCQAHGRWQNEYIKYKQLNVTETVKRESRSTRSHKQKETNNQQREKINTQESVSHHSKLKFHQSKKLKLFCPSVSKNCLHYLFLYYSTKKTH